MIEKTGRTRFKVIYHPNAQDDWDILRGSEDKYFDTLEEAKDFANKNKRKGKPFYWQPFIFKQEEIKTILYTWTSK